VGLRSDIWAPQVEMSIIPSDLIAMCIKIMKRYIQIAENSNNYLLSKELFNKYFQIKTLNENYADAQIIYLRKIVKDLIRYIEHIYAGVQNNKIL
jgi:hypothetical protein